MNSSKKSLTLLMTLTKDNNTDDIEKLLISNNRSSYKEISRAELALSARNNKKKLVAVLLHIKKSTNKTLSHKDTKKIKKKKVPITDLLS